MRHKIMSGRVGVKLIVALLITCSVLPIGGTQASDLSTTGGLLGMCQSSGTDYAYCLGFVSGHAAVMEQVGVGASGDFRGAMGMCVSMPYPTANAEVAAFVNWAQRNQQLWGKPSAVGVMLALAGAWPCA
jgi:hypothetical protein